MPLLGIDIPDSACAKPHVTGYYYYYANDPGPSVWQAEQPHYQPRRVSLKFGYTSVYIYLSGVHCRSLEEFRPSGHFLQGSEKRGWKEISSSARSRNLT